jgi:3D (Asp-Asp-Asp) domain-containing protein
MRYLRHLLALAALAGLVSCSSSSGGRTIAATRIGHVKTTAYTQSEADHKIYGATTAVGTQLKYGRTRSAATDWSVYPVGTQFQIEGEPYTYEVDDYGSALVGTNTIDLYKPDKTSMSSWGVRSVNIRVLRWGSFARSLAIMKPRTSNQHVKQMVQRIQKS